MWRMKAIYRKGQIYLKKSLFSSPSNVALVLNPRSDNYNDGNDIRNLDI